MDLLKTILAAQNGGAVGEIAQRLGISQDEAGNVLGKIAPALGRGLAGNASKADGLGRLMSALQQGQHQRYLDEPALAATEGGIEEGNKILGHILGSKDVSRQLASRAAEQTGVGADLIKQMLPMVATLAMGALSRESKGAGDGGALGGMLNSFLDADGDGSMVDDLMGMAGKLFR